LLLFNRREYHLVLTLLADLLGGWRIDVLSSCHGTDLDSTVRDALRCDELFVQLSRGVAFLCGLHERFLFSETAKDVEVFGFDNMVLFGLEESLLFSLLNHSLLTQIQRSLVGSRLVLSG